MIVNRRCKWQSKKESESVGAGETVNEERAKEKWEKKTELVGIAKDDNISFKTVPICRHWFAVVLICVN